EQVTARADCTLAEAVENIDIGGPAMLRSAAKNFARVAVATSPEQYAGLLAELEANDGKLSAATRFALSVAAFNRVAQYDAAISNYLSAVTDASAEVPVRAAFSAQANGSFVKVRALRYGENPHQQAAIYRDLHPAPGSLATFTQPQGQEQSYHNLADRDPAPERVPQLGARLAGNLHPAAGQGAELQQHRRQRRGLGMRAPVRRPGLRDRQARQPLRRGRGRRRGRGLRASLRHRPDQRLRRHHRLQPPA